MSQQTGLNSSGPGQLAHPKQGLRSDSTKPSRSTSTTRGTVSGLSRQGSSGQLSGAVRSGRPSLGSSGRTAAAAPSASGSNAGVSVLTAAATPPNTNAIQSKHHSTTGSAVMPSSSQATPPTSGDTLTPVPPTGPRPVFINNKLYGDEIPGFTPSVNTKGYTPKLSPQVEELQQQQLQQSRPQLVNDPTAAAGSSAPDSSAEASAVGMGIGFRSSRITSKAAGNSSSNLQKPTKPQHYLRTTGDLFQPPDQDVKEPCVVGVTSTTRLVSPAWNQHRPWLTGSWVMQRPTAFLQEAGASADQDQVPALCDLSTVDTSVAEAVLVDDLLTVMMGQAGQYIKHKLVEGEVYPRLGLWVQGIRDPSLQEQVERLLPLCECVFVIKRFVETRSQIQYPMVLQALAAAMRKLQEEWWVLVVQLEHQHKLGQLNLAALLYYCQAPAASLALLADIAGETAAKVELTSAGLLNLLVCRQRGLAGDRAGQQLVGGLLEAAAEPYFSILRQWMCSGVLDDPYGEFMVKEDQNVKGDSLTPAGEAAYWSMRFTLRGGVTEEFDVPVFLESSVEAILVTGKYLNVIQACGQPVPPCPEATLSKLRYDAAAAERGSPPFLAGIQAALSAAAGALLAHIMGPQGRLLSWLHCLKHFFLLDQGDFLVHLLEAGDAESPAPLSALAPHQLQGLLDTALRSSSLAASPHIDVLADGALVIKADKRSILQMVAATVHGSQQEASLRVAAPGPGSSGWEDLMLTLNTTWPFNLVVCKRQLLHYQVIFKQLLSLKHAERQLGYVWQVLRATKRLSKDDQARFRPWHLLCHQLLHVVGEVMRYTSIDVLEPLWCDMHTRLLQSRNMDEVIQLHNAFLSAALDRSMLRQADAVQHIHNLLAAAKELAKVVQTCDVQQTGASTGGSGGSSSLKQRKGAQLHLQVLSKFCRQVTLQEQLSQLQQKVDRELEMLLQGLQQHYKHLSQAPAGSLVNSSFTTSSVGADSGRKLGLGLHKLAGGGAAVVVDSSRELASLHNLIERLRLGEPDFEAVLAVQQF